MKRKHSQQLEGEMATPNRSAKKLNAQQSSPYVADIKLIPRIRKYLDEKTEKDPVDVDSISDFLQKNFMEYRRKKRASLRRSVSRAYDIILKDLSLSLDSEDDIDIEESSKRPVPVRSSSDIPDEEKSAYGLTASDLSDSDVPNNPNSNCVNNLVTDLYSQSQKTPSLSLSNVNHIKTGFIRSQSAPLLKSLQSKVTTEGFYIDRGPADMNAANSRDQISLPSSPKAKRAKPDKVKEHAHNSSLKVITISDDEMHETTTPPSVKDGNIPNDKGSEFEPQRKLPSNKLIEQTQAPTKLTQAPARPSQTPAKPTQAPAKPKQASAKPSKDIDAILSTTTFSQIGGNEKTILDIKRLLLHIKYPQIYEQIGITPPRGFLLHGPPGCGKTLMAHAIAGELRLPYFKLAATELVSGVSGESEERVRKLFNKAITSAPCIVFIDEIDAITPKRETASKDMERRIVSQLLTCLDDLCERKDASVLVIGATSRPDSLDPALRRAGRFDREICMGIPDDKARKSILKILCKDLRLAQDFDYDSISYMTPGYVGADLSSLVREAAMCAVNKLLNILSPSAVSMKLADTVCRTEESKKDQPTEALRSTAVVNENCEHEKEKDVEPSIDKKSETQNDNWWLMTPSAESLKTLVINQFDFMDALKFVQPSAKREGFATVPDITWSDIGALKSIREELQMAILAPVRYPEQFKSLGLCAPAGVLLAGPPGCGKTLLAKAIANEAGINFISVKGPELINMYVGESEKAVRQVFQRARNSSPCVIFFDELDSLCPRRSLSSGDSGSGARVVNQLLTEMDGLEERKQVFVMGATNRPDIIDPAILRPGRLDKTLYVGLPILEDRIDILKTITKNCTRPHIVGVDLLELASRHECDNFSGADLTALVREASMAAMKEFISQSTGAEQQKEIIVTGKHFDAAFLSVKPSISAKDKAYYEKMAENKG